MLGAIIGDIAGSVYEFDNCRRRDFMPFIREDATFTDDTVMTLAVARAIKDTWKNPRGPSLEERVAVRMHQFGNDYPGRGYGGRFAAWLASEDPKPYHSLGNGSAMRVSPVAWAFDSLGAVLEAAAATARPTHDHPEGVKGAMVTAGCTFLARTKHSPDQVRHFAAAFYDMGFKLDEIWEDFKFDETCPGTVPAAIECALEATSYEEAIRNCMWLGGDCDTTAAIAGAVAGALYGVPDEFYHVAKRILPKELWQILFSSIVDAGFAEVKFQ